HSDGAVIQALGATRPSTFAAIPMSAIRTFPQWSRPGNSAWPIFRRKNVTVSVAFTATPIPAPVVQLIPLGRPTAYTQDAVFVASIRARARPSTGLSRPAPNKASTTTSAGVTPVGAAAAEGPRQRCAATA